MFSLYSHDALLARNKLLSIQIETILMKLEANSLAEISSKGLGCDFCEPDHASGSCRPSSLGL